MLERQCRLAELNRYRTRFSVGRTPVVLSRREWGLGTELNRLKWLHRPPYRRDSQATSGPYGI
jgi:hypothetical protein